MLGFPCPHHVWPCHAASGRPDRVEMETAHHAWTSICPRCGAPNPEVAAFCMACAQPLKAAPPGVTLVGPGPGAPVGSATAAPLVSRPAPGPDDQTVRVVPGVTPRVPPPDDRSILLQSAARTTSKSGPASPDDATAIVPAGTARGTPSRGAPSRGGTPWVSRMSVLSSLADAGSTTLLTEGLEIAGRYRVKGLIGRGGMGVVYLVDDMALDREIALKVIRADIASSPETIERFKREIQLSSKVTHQNVLRVYDLGESEGAKFLTMEYVQGEDLSNIIKRDGRLPFDRVMHYFKQICAGLGVAHEQGVIHRDLKPHNVMIDPTDRVLLTDFGLATVAEGSSAARSGGIMGTPYYMSPEQARGEALDQRSDIYALGIMLYELLTGVVPFAGGTVLEVMKRRLTEKPRPIAELNADLPDYIRQVVDKCLATDREERYATCEEILKDIYDATEGRRRRRQTMAVLSLATVLVVGAVSASSWYVYQQKLAAALKEHEPVTVLIADFQNETGDPAFNGTLEPMMKLALEGAGFISAYDRNGIRRTLGVRPPEKLDERATRELAAKQGVGVVLSGTVQRQGSRYGVSVKAVQAVTGNLITTASSRASNKDQVLGAATKLAGSVRVALGDRKPDSAQRFAMETLSATSLDVIRDYAGAMEALSRSRFDEALQGFSKAVARDPNFGLAHAGMAIASQNLDRPQDAKRYVTEAIRHLDVMTERERYRTRGMYYLLTSDYQACVKEYGDLISRYAADAAARNNRALCLTKLRDMPKAVDEMRQVVKILPNRALYRENLAQYLVYSGDFQGAEEQARAMPDPGLFGVLPLAFAQLGQGLVPQAIETFQALAQVDEQGASYTASGLGDVAIYEGRFSDAVRILREGAAADLENKDADRAAGKFVALADALLLRQQKGLAMAAAEKALANSQAVKIRFLAARVFVEAGAPAKAGALSAGLAAELQAEPQAYAGILEGLAALESNNPREAIKHLTDANALLDTWIGHFDLGRAYLEAGAFTQADSEFDRCIKRRGEALALFLDEEPTYRFFPAVYYYQGRVREGLRSAKFAESYRAYLDIRGRSAEDVLLPDVRRRAGG